MLEEAHNLKAEGIDIVIGLLETHGRKETAERAKGLEVVPKMAMPCGKANANSHGNNTLYEMDTEAIIARSPQLVLVDELAHTNIPGSRREKRYQDVEIILEAGINVYSTVNIQHLESLNDLVARITGVVVRERIPDLVLEQADEVVVVDVTPETLEERLLEGKIYAPEKIQQALENFFQRPHLIALREIAWREVADTVEEDSNDLQYIENACPIRDRVLICISTYPNSIQLLRRGGRIASYMNAELFAIFVEDTDRFLNKEEALHIETCERLCQEFNGKFLRIKSQNIAGAIAEVAERERITQIVIGESLQSPWRRLFKGSLTRKLMKLIWKKHIDLHIISTDK